MKRWTISVPDDVAEEVMAEISYGDSRSEWIVDAIEAKLQGDIETQPVKEPDIQTDNVSAPSWIPEDVPKRFSEEEVAEVIEAAVRYIQEQKKATMREIVRDVMPQNSLGYDVPQVEQGKRIRIAWWRKIVRPGLVNHPDIRTPGPSESYYHWDG